MTRGLAASVASSLLIGFSAGPTGAALTSGLYQTLPNTTVLEWGDRVPNRSRVVPLSAFVTLDLEAVPPTLAASISNAVLEGGEPFALTVRSLSGTRLMDGTYRFTGDYLRDLYPSGTQYGFDWRFTGSTNDEVVWNGIAAWEGGHLWYVTISNLTIVLRPRLDIRQADAQVKVSWPVTDSAYVLEQAAGLPAIDWTTVTNSVSVLGDRFSVTVEGARTQGYFRLRKP
ncbi:MAG TPA: hypothetical protein VGK40_03295 [Verrucomicrobiae bacterium]|jgi:hypothetical protein